MPEIHKRIDFQGRKLHYRDEGAEHGNKTIVLLHGFAQDLTAWTHVMLNLMNEYRVICIDLPGHGFTDIYNNDVHTMEFIAQCVNEVLIAAGVGNCIIAGHSWGGYVALSYAASYQQNVKGVALIHSHAMADSEEKKQERLDICEDIKRNAPSFIARFIPSLFSSKSIAAQSSTIQTMKTIATKNSNALISAQMGMLRRKSMVPFLSTIRVPVSFIYGKEDNRIPLELASLQATIPPYSEMLMINDVAHMAHVERPKIVSRWLKNFIEECYQ